MEKKDKQIKKRKEKRKQKTKKNLTSLAFLHPSCTTTPP